jgi:hypothetical protein
MFRGTALGTLFTGQQACRQVYARCRTVLVFRRRDTHNRVDGQGPGSNRCREGHVRFLRQETHPSTRSSAGFPRRDVVRTDWLESGLSKAGRRCPKRCVEPEPNGDGCTRSAYQQPEVGLGGGKCPSVCSHDGPAERLRCQRIAAADSQEGAVDETGRPATARQTGIAVFRNRS